MDELNVISDPLGGRTPEAEATATNAQVLSVPEEHIGDVYGPEPEPDSLMLRPPEAVAMAGPERTPFVEWNRDGTFRLLREPDMDEDFTPMAREMYGNNWMAALRAIAHSPEARRAEYERAILRQITSAREMAPPEGKFPAWRFDLPEMARQTGMSEEEFAHWQERDPKYIANQITDRELLRLSGPDGYFTTMAKNPDLTEREREDLRIKAELEALSLGINPNAGFFDYAKYDVGVGFGQVAAFGMKGMAGVARFAADWADKGGVRQRDIQRFAAQTWDEWSKYAEARYAGPAIDTGNPVTDFVRTSLFQGGPMLGTFMALSMIPGVGSAGSAYIMGAGMGAGTYKTLRDEGISPGLSALAAGATGVVSYFSNKFTLDNLTRYAAGRSPWKLFSFGTLSEVAEEAGQELVENTSQATFEGLARLVGDPESTWSGEWSRWKDGFNGAVTESGMAGISTLGFRILGFPVAVRNQMRANTFAKTFVKSGDIVSRTEQYAHAPEALATQLTGMAIHNGGGPVFTSVSELSQAGITREQAVAPLAEGGLGMDAEQYDAVATTGEDITVGYGQAMVFAQKQKDAGNPNAANAFSADPDGMSVGQVKAMEAEADAIATEAEAYYTALRSGDDSATPLRIKTFRAGLRASGRYDASQADALTAMFWRGAERSAERRGVSVEEWLERADVQLEMDSLMGKKQDVNRYHGLIDESRARHDAAGMIAEGQPVADTGAGAMEEAAQGEVSSLMQEAVTDGDNLAWANEAAQNIIRELGVEGEQYQPLADGLTEAILQGVDNPDVRAVAEQLGIELPERIQSIAQPLEGNQETTIIDELYQSDPPPPLKPGEKRFLDIEGKRASILRIDEPVWTGSQKELREMIRPRIQSMRNQIVLNLDSNREIVIPQSGLNKAVSPEGRESATGDRILVPRTPQEFMALTRLPELLERAVPVVEAGDRKARNEVDRFYRFYAPLAINRDLYAVQLTVRGDRDGGNRFYLHRLQITEPAGIDSAGSGGTALYMGGDYNAIQAPPPWAASDISISQLLEFVKSDDIGELGQGNRGSITFPKYADAPTVIKLFKNADVSTVVHELNHLFVMDLKKMVESGQGGEDARRHLAALTEFAGGTLDRDGMERIASAWERYAIEGVAPSMELIDSFATIRKYVARIYRDGRDRGLVEPSPEVRRVFDAFLATDEQIEAAKERRDMNEDWSKAKGVGEKARKSVARIHARRDERMRRRMDAKQGGGRGLRSMSALDASRLVVRRELEGEPKYQAIVWAKAKGGMNREAAVAAIGEAAVKAIEETHGKNVFSEKGVDPAVVAANAGYETDVAEMLAEIAAAKDIESQAETEAMNRVDMAELEEDIAANDQDATEGVDWETEDAAQAEAGGDMTQNEEQDADTIDMIEEVGAAIEDEATDGGTKSAQRDVYAKLREWQNTQAVLKRRAREDVIGKTMWDGADLRTYRKARTNARRNAFAAATRGDRKGVTRWKKQEMYHHYQIMAAKEVRALRDRIRSKYSPHALKTAMDAKEHQAKIAYPYAQGMAQVAIYAGMGDSRYLRQIAGTTLDEKILTLPEESGDLGGIVENMADTLPTWLLQKQRPENFKDFRDFTGEQLFEIDRLMRWLIDNGRGKLSSMLDAEAATIDELVAKTTAPMSRRDSLKSTGGRDARTRWNRTLNAIKRFGISITIPENWFMAMDGNPTIQGKEMGPNQRLFRRMVDADVKKQMLYEARTKAMEPHFTKLIKEREAWEKRVGGRFATIDGLKAPEVLKRGRDISTWDFDLLLAVALNMGNDANLRRLLTDSEFAIRFGKKFDVEQDMAVPRYNMTNADLEIVARQFSAEGWRAIQGILDGVNEMYADSDRVTFALTNRHVVKEQATAHTVVTSDGQTMTMPGGYFPMVNDPMLSVRSRELNEKTAISDQIRTGHLNNAHGAAKQSPGAIKERARAEDGTPTVVLPQILSSDVITQHIETMAHYIAYAEILRDMDRLTSHETWRETYIDKFGQEQYDAVRRWLKNLAAPERGTNSPGEKFALLMRNLATINALGLRFQTGLKQRQGAFQAAAFMSDNGGGKLRGWKWLMAGVAEMGLKGNVGIRNAKVEFVNEKSEFMRARSGGFDREIRAMRSRLSPLHREFKGYSLADVQNATFFWIEANDVAMANAVWLGAYRQALAGEANFDIGKLRAELLEKGMSEEEIGLEIDKRAVQYADTAAATQASSFAADLTGLQRETGLMRFMSMFMSGSVRQGSRLMQYVDAYRMGDKSKGDVAWLAVREFVFPSLAWVFMRAAVLYAASAALGIEGDDDDLIKEAAWESLDAAAAPFPLVREMPRILQYGSLAGDVTAVKSAARAATNVIDAGKKMTDGEYGLAVGKAMDAAGFAFGIPVMNPLNEFRISEAVGLKKKKR